MIVSSHLYNLFVLYKNKPFIFVKPVENYGGLLIWKGAEKLATLAGINYKSINTKEFLQNNYDIKTAIYIHGGGGSNTFWVKNGAIDSLLKAITTYRGPVVLGPETFVDDKESLKGIIKVSSNYRKAEEISIFARERYSYQFLKNSLLKGIKIELDHDTALNLSVSDFDIMDVTSKYILYAIRRDMEKINIPNKDYFALWLDPIWQCRNFNEWFTLHARARKIFTNRLHSAILGSILGKPTALLPNSYHKNIGVWEYSLKDRGVEWHEDITTPYWNKYINTIPFIERAVSSCRFQSLMQILYGAR